MCPCVCGAEHLNNPIARLNKIIHKFIILDSGLQSPSSQVPQLMSSRLHEKSHDNSTRGDSFLNSPLLHDVSGHNSSQVITAATASQMIQPRLLAKKTNGISNLHLNFNPGAKLCNNYRSLQQQQE